MIYIMFPLFILQLLYELDSEILDFGVFLELAIFK